MEAYELQGPWLTIPSPSMALGLLKNTNLCTVPSPDHQHPPFFLPPSHKRKPPWTFATKDPSRHHCFFMVRKLTFLEYLCEPGPLQTLAQIILIAPREVGWLRHRAGMPLSKGTQHSSSPVSLCMSLPTHQPQLWSASHGQALYGWCIGLCPPKRVLSPGTCVTLFGTGLQM